MSKWKIDPDHSVASFSIRHMMIAHVHGQFNKVSGQIYFNHDTIPSTSIEISIDVSSIITGIKKRDTHLKSKDFFNQKKFPKINFMSSKVELTAFNTCRVFGDLTVHGITKPVEMDMNYFGPIKSPFGETSMGFTAKTRLNREDFGITWNEPMENGGYMVGRDVDIFIDIEADKVE